MTTEDQQQAHAIARAIRDHARDKLGLVLSDEDFDRILRFQDLCGDMAGDPNFNGFVVSQMYAWLSRDRQKQIVEEMEQWAKS